MLRSAGLGWTRLDSTPFLSLITIPKFRVDFIWLWGCPAVRPSRHPSACVCSEGFDLFWFNPSLMRRAAFRRIFFHPLCWDALSPSMGAAPRRGRDPSTFSKHFYLPSSSSNCLAFPSLTSWLLHFLVPVYSGPPTTTTTRNSFSLFSFLFEPGGRVFHCQPEINPQKKFNENGTVRNPIRQSSPLTTMSPTGRKNHPWLSLATCYLLMASTAILVAAAQHEPDRPLDQEQVPKFNSGIASAFRFHLKIRNYYFNRSYRICANCWICSST